ncbi:MAG: N-acetylmuramoyl-L-alanine amidase [Armatimonadota bacterium]
MDRLLTLLLVGMVAGFGPDQQVPPPLDPPPLPPAKQAQPIDKPKEAPIDTPKPKETPKPPEPKPVEPAPPKGDYDYPFIESPNHDGRPPKTKVDTIVLHHTEIPTLERTIYHFSNPSSRVSAHFIVGRDGSIVQMVKVSDRAWHAGASVDAAGRKETNNYSVGIEIVNLGDGRQPYPAAQLKAVKKLVKQLTKTFRIKQIVSHRYVAEPQGRKDDPVAFPWDTLSGFKVKFYRTRKPLGPPIPPILLAQMTKERDAKEGQARLGKARSKSEHKSSGDSKPTHRRKT